MFKCWMQTHRNHWCSCKLKFVYGENPLSLAIITKSKKFINTQGIAWPYLVSEPFQKHVSMFHSTSHFVMVSFLLLSVMSPWFHCPTVRELQIHNWFALLLGIPVIDQCPRLDQHSRPHTALPPGACPPAANPHGCGHAAQQPAHVRHRSLRPPKADCCRKLTS